MDTIYPITQLKNKLKIVSHQLSGRESVALGIFLQVGGRYEHKKIAGISHFIEHLVFKGTHTRNAKKIKEEIEGRGGVLNGYTSEDTTCFLVKIVKEHFTLALDILADMVQHARLDASDIERERTVILEEIKMYLDMPMHYVHDLMNQLLWDDHPLGMLISGDADSVRRISESDLVTFYKRYYVPVNTCVAVCGDIAHEKIVADVTRLFPSQSKKSRSQFAPYVARQTKPRFLFHEKETEQVHLMLGFPTMSRTNPDRYKMALLHVILGANMSSRLYEEVREKRGLAYEIRSGVSFYDDTGSFTVSAGVENSKVEKTITLIMKELLKVTRSGVTAGELKRAKEYMLNQLFFALDDTLEHMLWLGDKAMHLDHIPIKDDIRKTVEAVTIHDVQEMARTYFDANKLNYVMIGQCNEKRQNTIRECCSF